MAACAVSGALLPRAAEAGGNPWADLDRYKTSKLTQFADAGAVEAFRVRAEAATTAWTGQRDVRKRRVPDQYPPMPGQLSAGAIGCGANAMVVAGELAYMLHGDVLTTLNIVGTPRVVARVPLASANGEPTARGSYFPNATYYQVWVDGSTVVVSGAGSGSDRVFLVLSQVQGRLTLLHRYVVNGSGAFVAGKLVLYQASLLPFGASHASPTGPLESIAPARRSYRPLNETRGALVHRVSVCEPSTGSCDTTVLAAPSRGMPTVLGDSLYLWATPWQWDGEKNRSATLYRLPLDGGAVSAVYMPAQDYHLAPTLSLDGSGRVNALVKEGTTLSLYQILPHVLSPAVADKQVLEFRKTLPRTQVVAIAQPYMAKNWFWVTYTQQYVYYGAAYDSYIDPAHPQAPPPVPPDGNSVSTLFVQSLNGGATRRLIFDHFNYRSLKDGGSFGAYGIWPLEDDALVVRDAYVQLVSHDQAENAGQFEFKLDGGEVCAVASSRGDASGVIGLALLDYAPRRARALFLRRESNGLHVVGSGFMPAVASYRESNTRMFFDHGRWLFLAGDDLVEAAEVNGQVRERSRLSLD